MGVSPKISIIGAGMFGYALARVYGKLYNDAKIMLYDVNEEVVGQIEKTRQHPIHFRGKLVTDNVFATNDLEKVVSYADIMLLAVPAQFMRKAVASIKPHIGREIVLVDLAKALELKTGKRMSEVINEEFDGVPHKYHVCALAGGMLAGDVIMGNPVCAEFACEDLEVAKKTAEALTTPNLRLYTNTDVLGVELAGALKNVIAIAAGMFDGLFKIDEYMGSPAISSKAGLVSRASKEVKKIAMAMGASEHTFNPGSQAWEGDLMTSCFGNSRNRQFGELLVKLGSVGKALDEMKKINRLVEGYATAKVLHDFAKEKRIEFPVCEKIYKVLYEGKNPRIAAAELMSRPMKHIGE